MRRQVSCYKLLLLLLVVVLVLAVVVGGGCSCVCERCWHFFLRCLCGDDFDFASPLICLCIQQQVPELEQAMERCVYAESIAGDLLNGTGESRLKAAGTTK